MGLVTSTEDRRDARQIYLPAHQPGLAENGLPGERYVDYHRQRARAGLGMQITGATPVKWSEVWADGLTLVNVDDRIIPGWRACIVKETIESSSVQPVTQLAKATSEAPVVADGGPRPAVTDAIRPAVDGVDLTLVWLGAALALPLFGWRFVDDYMARKQAVLLVMRHYAHRFVREFERPLIQQPTELPLRARLRLRPARGRVDILLAPGEGRRYPNLSDHRKNLEYDVVRIARLLGDES